MKCRMCKSSNLKMYLDLGNHPPSDQFRKRQQLNDPVIFYPLQVFLCETCGLSQLGFVVSQKILFQEDYPYDSSITKTGKIHFLAFANSVVKKFKLGQDDLAIDIGSNVGVLLESFKKNGLKVFGVDPAPNIVKIANKNSIDTICDFFGPKSAREILKRDGKASIITATNVFAHVDDLNNFMKGVLLLLDKKGVFIIESPYMLNLVKNLEYDTLYHEHVSYLSVKPLVKYFAKFNLEIFDVEMVGIHGGSFRVYVSKKGNYKVEKIVSELVNKERATKLHSLASMKKFVQKVEKNRQELRFLLTNLKEKGKNIVALSAPAKGMTLINYCKIGKETLDFATEKNPLKIGRFTPGDNIPIVPDSKLLKEVPDYVLLLAWNFAPEIMENLKEYKKGGGKFIIPIPKPKII